MFNLFNKFFKSCVLFLEPWITYFIPSSLALLSTILDFFPVNITTSPPSFIQFTRAKPSFTLKALKELSLSSTYIFPSVKVPSTSRTKILIFSINLPYFFNKFLYSSRDILFVPEGTTIFFKIFVPVKFNFEPNEFM